MVRRRPFVFVCVWGLLLSAFAPGTAHAEENLAVRLLQMDAQVKPVTPAMYDKLNAVMDNACERITQLPAKKADSWDPTYVQSVFRCIDEAIVANGFLYPDAGLVAQLADALIPYKMTPARRAAFERQPHNKRRASMIAQRFPGPFYVADCDTTCFIYLGVADRLRLPIHLIDLPGFNTRAGHNIVRWREGDKFINWETMDGCVMSEDYYQREWKVTPAQREAGVALVDLIQEQVFGYNRTCLAIVYAERGEYDKALEELTMALGEYPQNLLACNNFAWYTAVGASVTKRDHPTAIYRSLYNLNLVNDPNVRDTLASVYASANLFELAVQEEKAAVAVTHSADFQSRLELFARHQVFREDKEEPAEAPFVQ